MDAKWMGVSIREIEEIYDVYIDQSVYDICDTVDEVCTNYFQWISIELSTVGKVSTPTIYRKLDELI